MSLPEIKIDFIDFWPGFIKTDNFFYELLSKKFNVLISDDPEVIFYSVYGNEYLKYKCLRIFYTAENTRADYSACDFALTFDYDSRPNHYRFPLYRFYICLLYTSPSPRDLSTSRMPSSA